MTKSNIENNEIDLYYYENSLYNEGFKYICGTDEAGRGCLAGPVVVASCILNKDDKIIGLNDSKKLSAKKRELLYNEIIKRALAYNIVFIDNKTIDEINILEASRLGMYKAVERLNIKADYCLSDAVKLDLLDIPNQALIHGDALSASIAAASILAKVSRDHYMESIDNKYPVFDFKKHKGYPTKYHREILKKYGVTDIHRLSYKPVKDVLNIQQEELDFSLDINKLES